MFISRNIPTGDEDATNLDIPKEKNTTQLIFADLLPNIYFGTGIHNCCQLFANYCIVLFFYCYVLYRVPVVFEVGLVICIITLIYVS